MNSVMYSEVTIIVTYMCSSILIAYSKPKGEKTPNEKAQCSRVIARCMLS